MKDAFRHRAGGFSMVQLLVVIAMFAMILTYAVLVSHRTRYGYGSSRVKCQSNLSQIGKALFLYANENKGAFPRTYDVDGAPIQTSNAGFADANPDSPPIDAARTNNIPQAMFLLIRNEDLTPSVFICPYGTASADSMGGMSAMSRSNFTGDGQVGGSVLPNCSYSFVNVYPTSAAIKKGYGTTQTAFSADFAVAADISPAAMNDPRWTKIFVGVPRTVMMQGNSPNHDGQGQNVLYADGHAEYQQTPLCGANNDNIYTAQDVSTSAADKGYSVVHDDPQSAADSILFLHAP